MIEDKDKGFKAFMEEMKKAKEKPAVKIGVLASSNEKVESGIDLVGYASANEFGTNRIPERSFMRATIDESGPQINRLINFLGQKIAEGKLLLTDALPIVGEFVETKIKKKIGSNLPPPNAESTILRKLSKSKGKKGNAEKVRYVKAGHGALATGMPKTLIDTGRLRQSIAWQIVDGGEQ